ncbi:MAG: DUF1232 domain-containing protein [Oscillochloris sp.]|nr:DUF1232 domain-containing protein [Oscillochloris sp.]
MSWLFTAVTTLLGIYILSPLDLLPDLIPFLGQADDIVALITALFAGISIFVTRWAANRPFELPDEQLENTTHRKRLPPPRD